MGKHSKPSSRRTARALSTAAAALGGVAATSGVATAADLVGGPPGGWGPVVACESNGNAKATNPHSTASGAWQFIDGTWAENGGRQFARRAKDATFEQQNIVANRTYARHGLDPWEASKHCWGPKVGKHAKTRPVAPQKTRQYTVKRGDSLSSISVNRGFTWQQLWASNRQQITNPGMIHPGQILNLP